VIAIPGLREWGSGLEELTECYLKYSRRYLVEAGRVFQLKKEIKHPTVPASSYPHDIDLIAVNPSTREVALVSCSESWDKTLQKTLEEFEEYENFIRNSKELGYGNKVAVERKIACVSISEKKKSDFAKNGIEVLEARFMISELLDHLKKESDQKRKGAHRETVLWLLQTLNKCVRTEEQSR